MIHPRIAKAPSPTVNRSKFIKLSFALTNLAFDASAGEFRTAKSPSGFVAWTG
jgi:hypothetical protein